MIKAIVTFEGRIAKVSGCARGGKTEALVQRCAKLVENGIDPESILVETTTSLAAQAFRRRLVGAGIDEKKAERVRIETALGICVRVLKSDEACAYTWRYPRILNSAEYNFFLEDMKTLGQPVRRLKKMLAFFFRQWSNLEPQDEWMLAGEEESVYKHMVRVLSMRGAMLAEEAPTICANFLKSDQGAAARGSFAYVLCDDFQNLSHAEQTCMCLLADKQVIVAGNPNETIERRSCTVNPQGFVEFDKLRRNVETFELTTAWGNPNVESIVESLVRNTSMDDAFAATSVNGEGPEAQCIKWATPDDELVGLTKYLRVMQDENPDRLESTTCILVPNKRWGKIVEKALQQRGFAVCKSGVSAGISGDPRDTSRACALVAYTKLNLLADPHDMTAWRSWCGFDNYLTNSDAWNSLQDFAENNQLMLQEALEVIAASNGEPFLRANDLKKRYIEGKLFVEKNMKRKGFNLLRAIGAESLPEFEDVADRIEGDENAEELFAIAQACLLEPTFNDNLRAIHLASYDSMTGLNYDTVVAIACVDGFVPHRDAFEAISMEEDRIKVLDADRRAFITAVASCDRQFIFSFFVKSDLELAERTKMQVARVKAEDGKRVASVRRSVYLSEAQGACPATQGGQAILAQLGLN